MTLQTCMRACIALCSGCSAAHMLAQHQVLKCCNPLDHHSNKGADMLLPISLQYSRQAVQVSCGCVERGRLMADLWTSQTELYTSILVNLKRNNDAHVALVHALHRKHKALDSACAGLRHKHKAAQEENARLSQRVEELEELLKFNERAAWGVVTVRK